MKLSYKAEGLMLRMTIAGLAGIVVGDLMLLPQIITWHPVVMVWVGAILCLLAGLLTPPLVAIFGLAGLCVGMFIALLANSTLDFTAYVIHTAVPRLVCFLISGIVSRYTFIRAYHRARKKDSAQHSRNSQK